jgi:ankyrin repeat protein
MQVSQPINDIDVDCGDIHEAVSKGHVGCLQYFTSRHDAITANFKQQTPFHLIDHRTAPLCHELTTTLLKALSAEAATTLVNTADARGNTALHSTARYELDAGGEVIDFDDDSLTVCHTCMRALLAVGADPTIKNKADVQAVRMSDVLTTATRDSREDDTATADECIATVRALQQAGVDVTRCKEYTDYHLHSAAGDDFMYASDVAVKVLLACGADVMLRNGKGWTALHSAAYFESAHGCDSAGNADVIQMLYDAAGDSCDDLLNATTHDGQTALHMAVTYPESSEMLCQLGADVDVRDNSGQTALHEVCNNSWPVQLLLNYDADTNVYSSPVTGYESTGGWQPLHFVAANGHDRDVLDVLMYAGVDINVRTTAGCSAAWLTARYRSAPYGSTYLQMLFDRGADLWHYSPIHGSLLHAAAGSGDVTRMQLLLDKGLVLFHHRRHYTRKRQTPLHCAAQGGHVAMVQLLIDKGCDVTDTDVDGNTALRLCLQGPKDDAACFQLLVQAGCDVLDISDKSR